jgi:hypothetical protein
MPAGIAGIQVRTDASGDIRVNLDSSTSCWNDAIEGFRFRLTEAHPSRIFSSRRTRRTGSIKPEKMFSSSVLPYGKFPPLAQIYVPKLRSGRVSNPPLQFDFFLHCLRSLRLNSLLCGASSTCGDFGAAVGHAVNRPGVIVRDKQRAVLHDLHVHRPAAVFVVLEKAGEKWLLRLHGAILVELH